MCVSLGISVGSAEDVKLLPKAGSYERSREQYEQLEDDEQ